MLRPGFLRGLLGMVMIGAAAGFAYASLALGGIHSVTALISLGMGLLMAGVRGLAFGGIFLIPAYFLLQWPVPPQTADFGTLFVALTVYLGLVPVVLVALGFLLKKITGAVLAALIAAPLYVTLLVIFPNPPGPGINQGAVMMFTGFGMALGFLWGIGAASPGASSHEGPAYHAALAVQERPRPVRQMREMTAKMIPVMISTFAPLIRPLLIALGVTVVLVGAVVFVATNPIVPVSQSQTRSVVADAAAVTGEKLLLFVVITVVILGAVATFAILISLGISLLNREVNAAKKSAAEPLEELPKAFRLVDFFVNWLNDILTGLRRVLSR